MANQEQVAELRKGVGHWNSWVKEQRRLASQRGDTFKINFFRMPFRRVLLGHYDELYDKLDFTAADFAGANFEGADLSGLILKVADFTGADVRSSITITDIDERRFTVVYTNLRGALYLTQDQLDSMQGDSGTIIPDHLDRPTHWKVLDGHWNGEPIRKISAAPLEKMLPSGQDGKETGTKHLVHAKIEQDPEAILFGSHSLHALIEAEIKRLSEKNWQTDMDQADG